MKKLINFTIILTGMFVASCASDKKDEPVPSSTDARDKFVAHWNVIENSAVAGQNSFVVNITKSTTNSGEIIIDNFSGLQASVRSSVNNNILTIPYQQIGTVGFTKGSGSLTSTTRISLNYTTTIGTSRDSSTAVYTKQ
jgi:hypothetical protein